MFNESQNGIALLAGAETRADGSLGGNADSPKLPLILNPKLVFLVAPIASAGRRFFFNATVGLGRAFEESVQQGQTVVAWGL